MPKSIEKIEDLSFDSKNINKGSEFGTSLLHKSLTETGAGRSVLADKNGVLVAGNKTVEAAMQVGISKIKVVQTTGDELVIVQRTDIDINTPEGAMLKILDNTVSRVNYVEDAEVAEAICEEYNLKPSELGLQTAVITPEAKEDDYEMPDEIKTDIVLGDLFEIGEHRLLCGDSTDSDAVIELMAGAKADLMFTDPPYNVAFNGRSGKFDVIENDDLPEGDFNDFINGFIAIVSLLRPQTYYICCNWAFYGVLQLKLKPKACIVWAKNVFGLGRGYRHQHEFILFDGFIDASITNESDLWQIKKDSNYKHPTQKPVELSARAIKNSSKEGNVVVDLFGGSGSTLAAIHQLKRIGRIMELDPKYCQVIVDRIKKLDPDLEIKRNGKPYG